MDSARFDRLAVALSARLSRRHALVTGAAGFSALAAAAQQLPASAQDATPAAVDSADSSPGFLYIQLAERGTWTPKPEEDGLFELALYGTGEQTIYFATGSDRIVGTMPTDRFLDELGFTPANPPNAAVEVWTADGERDVLVVQLIDPVFTRTFGDDAEEVLVYDARVLSAYAGERLTEWLPDVDDDRLPVEFTNVSLFIDYGCFPLEGCYLVNGDGSLGARIASLPAGRARQFPDAIGRCSPCCGNSLGSLISVCNAVYPDCEGRCTAA